jgi:hypothetical protein
LGAYPGDADYVFGDIKNYAPINRKAVLRNARMVQVLCWFEDGVFYDTWTLEVQPNNFLADRLDEEPPAPNGLASTEVKTREPTYATYCYYMNWYDSNWHYLYSEEILGSCWTVEET